MIQFDLELRASSIRPTHFWIRHKHSEFIEDDLDIYNRNTSLLFECLSSGYVLVKNSLNKMNYIVHVSGLNKLSDHYEIIDIK